MKLPNIRRKKHHKSTLSEEPQAWLASQVLKGGSMIKALSFVTIVILLGAVSLGLSLSKPNPVDIAEAHRMDVETAALVAQYELEEEIRKAELDRIREGNNIKVEALRARLAKEADLHEFAVLFGLAVAAVATLVPSVALAYYLVRRGNAVRAGQRVASEKPGLRLLEFPSTSSGQGPSPAKRKRKQSQMSSYGWPNEAA